MAKTQIEFEYWSAESVNSVSRSARFLDLEGKGWCNEQRTDGALPLAMLRRITDADDPQADAAELVAAGLWVQTEKGWQLDWTHQETATQAANKAEGNRRRNRNFETAKKDREQRHANGDHSRCVRPYCKNGVTNAVSDAVSDAPSNTYPTQTRPTKTNQDQPVRVGRGLGGTAKSRPASGANAPTASEPRPYGDYDTAEELDAAVDAYMREATGGN